MKKKIVPVIVATSICALLGGLIFLGVSAFPELLEEEELEENKEVKAIPNNKQALVFEQEITFAPANDEVEAAPSNYVSSPITSHDSELIVINVSPKSSKVKNHSDFEIHSFKDSVISKDISDIHIIKSDSYFGDYENTKIDTAVTEETISTEHFFYSSSESNETGHVIKNKAKKAKVNKTQSVRSNEAVVETSLIVIGAVDVFSMILIKRRKHLFR